MPVTVLNNHLIKNVTAGVVESSHNNAWPSLKIRVLPNLYDFRSVDTVLVLTDGFFLSARRF